MISTPMKYIAWVAVSCLMLGACSSKQSALEAETEAFCAIHEKEHWEPKVGEGLQNGFDFIAAETRKVVQSEAFMSVFKKLAEEGYDDYYQALQVEISKMLGKPWHCESAKKFYTVEWKRVSDDKIKKEVVVEILRGGALVIAGTEYVAENVDDIRKALQIAANGDKYQVLLKLPENTSEDELNKYLNPFREMGITELSVLAN